MTSWGAELERYRGDISVNGRTTFARGHQLKQGDRIVARGKKSFFVVKYQDGSRFMVRDGDLKITKLTQHSSKVGLVRGTLLSFVKPESKHNFSLETKTASLGVRGTKFWVSESEKETYLCVCQGKVSIGNDSGSVVVAKNEDIRVGSRKQKLVKSEASTVMWNMAVEGFKQLGVPIDPR